MIDFSDLKLDIVEQTDEKGTFEIGPLPRGYGHTLANSLRRVLLSSLEGSAVTSIRIAGIDHEYSTIEGVKETVIDVEMNVKAIRFKCTSDQPQVIRLSTNEEGTVTAGDLELTESVEVVNPDCEILTITGEDTAVDMELVVEKGMGYRDADEELRSEAGRLPLDADFGPIERVLFSVSETRKGEQMNLDMISLTIFTDGSIMPEDALEAASKVLREAFDRLELLLTTDIQEEDEKDAESEEEKKQEEKEMEEKKQEEKLGDIAVEDLPISKRTRTTLMDADINKLEDVTKCSSEELLNISGFGDKSLQEVKDLLEGYGMSLKED
jgi:DNA-directed RNA polymerase subunit alpha